MARSVVSLQEIAVFSALAGLNSRVSEKATVTRAYQASALLLRTPLCSNGCQKAVNYGGTAISYGA
eukprot:6207641-Pleurochrysis_carterae.AAC.4